MSVVVDYGDTRISQFTIEYLCENEMFKKLFYPVHMRPDSEQKREVENLVTLLLYKGYPHI